jgi:hypothetical protein
MSIDWQYTLPIERRVRDISHVWLVPAAICAFTVAIFVGAVAQGTPILTAPPAYFMRATDGADLQRMYEEFGDIRPGDGWPGGRWDDPGTQIDAAGINTTIVCFPDCADDTDGSSLFPSDRPHRDLARTGGSGPSTGKPTDGGPSPIVLDGFLDFLHVANDPPRAGPNIRAESPSDRLAFTDKQVARTLDDANTTAASTLDSFSASEINDFDERSAAVDGYGKIATNECVVGRNTNCLIHADSIPGVLEWGLGGAAIIGLLLLMRS